MCMASLTTSPLRNNDFGDIDFGSDNGSNSYSNSNNDDFSDALNNLSSNTQTNNNINGSDEWDMSENNDETGTTPSNKKVAIIVA